ncbi:MAG TPA: hypothetical protein VFU88_20620 [Ktedonobacterales bacterium]|nr:hypothetical protein [Ktedonobacterales bacterium]
MQGAALAWIWMSLGAGRTLADGATTFTQIGDFARAFASIVAGLIAILGVPLALRQVVNLQRELRRYEMESRRRLDAETNLNISARYSLTRPARPAPESPANGQALRAEQGAVSEQPSPAAEPGKRVLRLDVTLENVGEGTVDVLGCLVAARELERQGEGVISAGRDAQWEDLTAHYWDDDPAHSLSPGLSTTKHIVYALDALARIKAKSHKTLARIDQVRERGAGDVYLLYRIFVAAKRSSRSTDEVRGWLALQRALLNVNAPAFRSVAGERDPLGYAASADGWRLFVHHHAALADPKLPQLRQAADREIAAVSASAEHERVSARHDAALREHCERVLLPGWQRFKTDYERMLREPAGFQALLGERGFRRRQREVERVFPWSAQEVWTEYFYVTLQDEQA